MKTAFLDHPHAQHLVSQVKQYRGTESELWMFVMKRVKEIAAMNLEREPSPFLLRAGYEQIMDTAFK